MIWTDLLKSDFEQAGMMLWKGVVNPVAVNWESLFSETSSGEFRAESAAIEGAVRGSQKSPIIDWTRVTDSIDAVLKARSGDWRAGFIPLFQGLMIDFGETWSAQLGVDFALLNPHVQEFVDDYTFKFVNRIMDVTRDDLAGMVGLAQSEGWSILDLIGSTRDGTGLRGMYDGWSFLRAEMIARTETIRSENAGALASYIEAGVGEVQWWTAEDDRVCPFCGKLHGKKWAAGMPLFGMGDVFRVETEGGVSVLKLNYEDVLYPPLHVFCRCTLLPVI
ncbi:MAG: hypothetical protein JXR84_15320 [Anaerolineae bacterium]|nr:hypothetical protein [Anaerolineae bacterium]